MTEPAARRAVGTSDEPGRRQRKKLATRQALQDAARELFARNGFAQTTVQQIADAADVSERTFFRYFDTKEDLLLPDLADTFAAITAAVRARPPQEAPMVAVREACLAAVGSGLLSVAPGVGTDAKLLDGRLIRAFVEWEAGLAQALAERLEPAAAGRPASEVALEAQVTARMAIALLRTAALTARAWLAAGHPEAGDVRQLLHSVFATAAAAF